MMIHCEAVKAKQVFKVIRSLPKTYVTRIHTPNDYQSSSKRVKYLELSGERKSNPCLREQL